MTTSAPEPQAVDAPATPYAIFIVATITRSAAAHAQVRDWCGNVAALVRTVGHRGQRRP